MADKLTSAVTVKLVTLRITKYAQKHPHVRGEDLTSNRAPGRAMETPPRAWGRPRAWAGAAWAGGNTPTCVGKTAGCRASVLLAWKHPHVRGEDLPSA